MFSFNISYKVAGVFCFAATAPCIQSMEEQPAVTHHSFIYNVLVGSTAGATEALVNQPTVFVKNLLQQRKKEIKRRGLVHTLKRIITHEPSQFYRGLGINMICMVPTTAAQVSINEKLKEVIPGEDIPTSFGRNAIAGGFSALTCNTSELIVVNQQNWKANPWHTVQRLYQASGAAVALRGYIAKALRDSIFCAGFLTAYPMIKHYFEEKIGNQLVATILATATVGPVTAAISHPFDTVSTKMQGDPSKQKFTGLIHAATRVYKEEGLKAFFSGLTPRTARVLVAIPLMTGVKDMLSSNQ